MVTKGINQAIILVGGFGTRLHPLTLTTPKPLIPFMNYTLLEHQIQALVDCGVEKIVLALHYKYESIIERIKEINKFGVDFIFSIERVPLNTAGPIELAKRHLKDKPFFVFNSDVICKYPLNDLQNAFFTSNCIGIILTTEVGNPDKFGVIVTENNLVIKFVEKPSEYISNKINAGIYVLSPEIFKFLEAGSSSLEKNIFPRLVEIEMLQSMPLKSFWMDIGTPEGYLEGQKLYIENSKHLFYHNKNDIGNDLKTGEDKISGKYSIDNNVVIGNNVIIGEGCHLSNCTVFDNTVIGNNVVIENSIIGKNVIIGNGLVIKNYSVIGDYTKLYLN